MEILEGCRLIGRVWIDHIEEHTIRMAKDADLLGGIHALRSAEVFAYAGGRRAGAVWDGADAGRTRRRTGGRAIRSHCSSACWNSAAAGIRSRRRWKCFTTTRPGLGRTPSSTSRPIRVETLMEAEPAGTRQVR